MSSGAAMAHAVLWANAASCYTMDDNTAHCVGIVAAIANFEYLYTYISITAHAFLDYPATVVLHSRVLFLWGTIFLFFGIDSSVT